MVWARKTKKIAICIILAVVIGILGICYGKQRYMISFNASRNDLVMEMISGNVPSSYLVNKIIVRLHRPDENGETRGTVRLIMENCSEQFEVDGYLYKIDAPNGYNGVLEGELDNGTIVNIDIVYVSREENFTAVTIGTAGNAEITFLGDKVGGELKKLIPLCKTEFHFAAVNSAFCSHAPQKMKLAI